MLSVVALLSLLQVTTTPRASPGERARTIVRVATRAVAADSDAAVAIQWRARIARGADDGTAGLSLATIARVRHRYAEADRLYGELLGPASRTDEIARYARLGRGQLRLFALLLTSASDDFTRAESDARAAGDSSAQASALLGTIHVRGRQRGGRGVLALLDSALRLVPTRDTLARADIACAPEQLERAPRATVTLSSAAKMEAAIAGAPRLVVQCQILRVAAYARLVKLDSAALALAEANALASMLRDSSLLATLSLIRGITWRIVGQSELSLIELHKTMRGARAAGDSSNIAYAGYQLGALSLAFGDGYLAERYAREASAIFTRAGDNLGLAYMRALQADLAVRRGDLAGARQIYRTGLQWADRQADVPVTVSMLGGLASVEVKESQWAAALSHIDSAYALSKAYVSSATKPSFDFLRAYVARGRGDLEQAERGFRARIALIQPAQNELRHGARVSLAEVLLARGDLRAAEAELVAATADLDNYRASLSDEQMRLHAVDRSNELGGGNDEADAIIAASALAGHTRVAFELAERRRARTLLDNLLRADVLARGGSPRAALRPSRRSDIATLDSLIAAIPDERTAIIEFVSVVGRPSAALVITKAGARAYPVAPIDSVRGMIGRFVTLLESGMSGGALASRLGKALLAAPMSELPRSVDRLIIVPDDALQRLPWSAIATGDGKSLMERYAVSTVPSATVLMRLWRQRRGSIGRGILAFGDPDVAALPLGGLLQASDDDRGARARTRLPRLPGSAAEARFVSALATHRMLRLGADATESYLKHAPLDSFAVVHFATHAFVDEQTTTRTWLALAAGGGEDGFVGPAELAALSLRADLVVLSGCSTGRGVLVAGEGVQGLTTPLLEAGARAVLATQWEVTDRSARSLVQRFYAALSRGLDVGDALRAAKREEASRGAPARDWAAFTLVGDPTVHPALDRAR